MIVGLTLAIFLLFASLNKISLVNKIMKSKYCLSSTASFDRINKAPTNRSTTKQTFSFGRTSRFISTPATCPQSTYGGDYQKRKPSATSIGFGNRSDFTKCLTASPSAGKYQPASLWDSNKAQHKGAVIGLGRNKVSFNHYIPKEPTKVPSPAHYLNQKISRKISPKYTLRPKTVVLDKTKTIQPQNKNPGPGQYLNPELDSRSASKFQKISYGQAKSARFPSSCTISPGPGKYKDINNMHKTGQYFLSQSKGGTKAKFDKTQRESMFDQVYRKELENPGPGYYQMPSEFGQYDGDIYNDLRTTKRSRNGWNLHSDRVIRH